VSFNVLQLWLKMPIHAPFWVVFGDLTPSWDTESTKVESTGYSGSSGVLILLVSIVVPEKLPGQKRCDEEDGEEEEEHEFLGVFDVFKITPT